jgi:hypothetical protein
MVKKLVGFHDIWHEDYAQLHVTSSCSSRRERKTCLGISVFLFIHTRKTVSHPVTRLAIQVTVFHHTPHPRLVESFNQGMRIKCDSNKRVPMT